MADELSDAAHLQARIDSVRRDYADLRDNLDQRLACHFVDPQDVADRLLSVIDEFGREHAMQLFGERPGDYGVHHQEAAPGWRESAASYEEDVERLVDLHDQLDALAAERERIAPPNQAKPGRVVNIQGREYAFDVERGRLHELETGQQYPVELPPREDEKLTLTQRAMRDTTAAKAEPQRDRDRDRGR